MNRATATSGTSGTKFVSQDSSEKFSTRLTLELSPADSSMWRENTFFIKRSGLRASSTWPIQFALELTVRDVFGDSYVVKWNDASPVTLGLEVDAEK